MMMKICPTALGYFLLYVYDTKLTKKSQSNLRVQQFRLFAWLKHLEENNLQSFPDKSTA
jgi:hypothetical protein